MGRLTLGLAKEKLAQHSPPEQLEDRINRSIERILVDGKFNGSMDRIMLQVLNGDITLPRQYRTLEGIKIDKDATGAYRVRTLTNGWYEFLESKVTIQDLDQHGYGMDTVQSRGDGWPIMHDLPIGGYLRYGPIAPATPTLKIYGRDVNSMPITLTFTGPGTQANNFVRIDRIHESISTTASFLYHNPDLLTTDPNPLAIIEPLEQETFYRRYHDDALSNIASCNAICYVKRRHIEYESDDDILEITNLTALGFEMDSLHYMSENDVSLANQYHDEAIRVLNEELRDTHAVDEVPTLRFRHPGGAPRLVSHF